MEQQTVMMTQVSISACLACSPQQCEQFVCFCYMTCSMRLGTSVGHKQVDAWTGGDACPSTNAIGSVGHMTPGMCGTTPSGICVCPYTRDVCLLPPEDVGGMRLVAWAKCRAFGGYVYFCLAGWCVRCGNLARHVMGKVQGSQEVVYICVWLVGVCAGGGSPPGFWMPEGGSSSGDEGGSEDGDEAAAGGSGSSSSEGGDDDAEGMEGVAGPLDREEDGSEGGWTGQNRQGQETGVLQGGVFMFSGGESELWGAVNIKQGKALVGRSHSKNKCHAALPLSASDQKVPRWSEALYNMLVLTMAAFCRATCLKPTPSTWSCNPGQAEPR